MTDKFINEEGETDLLSYAEELQRMYADTLVLRREIIIPLFRCGLQIMTSFQSIQYAEGGKE